MDEHLLEALAGIDRPGDIFAAGDRAPAMPGLEVEGLGTVRLPLPKAQARALIRRCRQAPYGKGARTLVDTDVRRVWEMDPAQFELTNPKWDGLIESILDEVRQRLGLEKCKLSAHLYKLLLYEKGSFFLPHRDGERLDAMVATLIVALPGAHEGGELVVRHEGREHEMGEIIDTSLTASHWSDRHGNPRQFGEMRVDDDEVVSGDALDDGEPSEEEFEDYTGNAGLTLERWYHRGAIVIWPRERHFAVLCGAGTQAAIGGLEAMVKGPRRGSKEQREATRRDAMQFAGAIIDGWTPPRASWIGDIDAKVDRSLFSKLLCKLDDPGLLRRFLSEILPDDGSAELHREFAKVCGRHGLRSFETELAQAIDAASEATLLRNAKLLHLLCRQPDHDKRDAAVCTRLCASAVAALERFDGQAPKDAWGFRTLDRTALLVTLVSVMLEIGAKRPLRKLIDHTLAHPELYDLTDTHRAAITEHLTLERMAEHHHPSGETRA